MKHTVTEFVIEVGFQEKVTAGLQKLESKVMAGAVKMEKALSNVFAKDHTAPLEKKIRNLETLTRNVAQQMNRSLNHAFDAKVNSRRMFGGVITDANRAAKEANRILNGVGRGLRIGGNGHPARGNGSNGNNGGNSGGGRPPRENPAQAMYNRFRTSATMSRLELSGGQSSIFAREIQARAATAMNRFGNDTDRLRQYFALLNAQVREHTTQVRADTAALRRHQQQGLRDAERANRGGGGSLGGGSRRTPHEPSSGAMGVFKGALAANAVTFAVTEFVQMAKDSFELGKERSQSKTMLETAVGEEMAPHMQKRLNNYSDQYGLDYTDTTKEYSQMRAVFGKDAMSNMQLLKMMENESVFAHSSGLNNEQVKGANRQLSQISSGTTVMKSDLNALGQNIPEWARVVGQGMNKDAEWVKKNYQSLTPRKFMEAWQKGLQSLNDQSGAALKAQQSIQAQQGRMVNAWKNDLIAGFSASGSSVEDWMGKLTYALNDLRPVFVALGASAGWLADKFSDVSDRAHSVGDAFGELWKSFSPENQENLRKTGGLLALVMKSMVDMPFDKFNALLDNLTLLIKMWAGTAKPEDVQKKLESENGGKFEGSRLESWMQSLRESLGFDSSTPAFDAMKANAGLSGAEDYGYKNGNYDLKAKAVDAGNRFDLGANKVDVNLKPTPLNGDVTVTVNFDEGSLNRAIAKVSGQAIIDHSETTNVNAGSMGGGWSGAQNNAGWKSGSYNLSY